MVELREYEAKTLTTLRDLDGKATVQQLTASSGLPEAAVMRSVLALTEKNLVTTTETRQTLIRLTEEGETDARQGLPERRVVTLLNQTGGKASLEQITTETGLEQRFIPIVLGWIHRKGWAKLDPKTGVLQAQGKPDEGNDEKLLKQLRKTQETLVETLNPELREAVQILKGRKLLELDEKKIRLVELTEAGKAAAKRGLKAKAEVTQLTPELIISGKWRKVKLRAYNVEAPVARTWLGKKHPYMRFLDEVREKLVALGFREMAGTAVETSFFNFDALYTPQGHPAREPSSAYYIKSPAYGSIDAYRNVSENVRKTHESGWKTGSTGWKYAYSVQESKRLILRSHTTCLSARTLLSRNLEIPSMHFSIGRCYRPEVLDKTHLTEFNQVEGIIVDKNLTLRNLLGVLEKFAIDIAGADRAKFVPDYFPFTEPSVELRAYRKGYGWIEFGGSGIFRPEVTLPLGIDVPVLAWGLGIDRLFMLKAGISDIREVFSTNLDWLRKQEMT